MNNSYHPRPWMKHVLIAAGIYNIVWGLLAVLVPNLTLSLLGVDASVIAIQFWQCIGMMVGVFGVGYLIASKHPFLHWPMTLVGLLGKIFGPIGFVAGVVGGSLPATMGWTILTNDVIWWIPFGIILWESIRHHRSLGSAYVTPESDDPLRELRTNTGCRLDDLADVRPQLVIFLRHLGCTFCRETLSDLSTQRAKIQSLGFGIVLIHPGDEDDEEFFGRYGLNDVPRISDPACRLYRQFGLDLGGFSQLFGIRVWLRGFVAGILHGHGVGAIRGNSFQMPGVYLYHCGQIVDGFRHDTASDRPDYVGLLERNRRVDAEAMAVSS